MGNSLQLPLRNLIVSPKSERRQLFLNHPEAKPVKDKGVVMAAVCNLRETCSIFRRYPAFHVLIFSLQGRATLFASESPKAGIPIKPGEVAILPARQQHKYVMESKEWKALWFYLSDTPVWHHLLNTRPHTQTSLVAEELHAAMEGFLAESLRNDPQASQALKLYAQLILLNLDRELDSKDPPAQRQMRQRLFQLWQDINADLAQNWTVPQMARQVGLSPQHFYKVTARYSGCKPMERVTRLRMQQAREYLLSTDYMIKSIARLVGYSDSFSFSSAFTREVGCSPRQFREKYHSQCAQKEKEESENGWY